MDPAKTIPEVTPAALAFLGSSVRKKGGDYTFEGIIVSVFTKKSGVLRMVVEDDRGVLHIFSASQLQPL
jgi:hypothetical protein